MNMLPSRMGNQRYEGYALSVELRYSESGRVKP